MYPNHRHHCGFCFIQYEVQRFSVNSSDITWAPQSYLANQNEFPQFDTTQELQPPKPKQSSDLISTKIVDILQ
ncbi:hypothetical protein THRCLA_21112 [Thraustotheca clavata]|uniref:Uncharacterized protein n=1 Tax=Thraustotheca clavata TaxID=74557 RepID=A0A1W0A052_9STRA|nr:hypothetical protein THRCLA_21112 [Thraustotheca clavata]